MNMHTTETRSCPIAFRNALPVMIVSGALVLLAVLAFARWGQRAPAIPTDHEFQQPDGTRFSARLWGDERAHGWETLNGYTIVKDPKTNYWCYAQMDPTTKGLIPGTTVGGQGSMKDYYEEVSYGAFTITSGSSGVTGWYTAADSHHYYGQNDASGYDLYAAQLVIETVAAADAAIDFSEYDTDGDCYADVVVIIHQGSGEEAGGPPSDIWSHRWNLRSAAYYGDGSGVYTTDDVATCGQIKVNDYVIQPETLYGEIQRRF